MKKSKHYIYIEKSFWLFRFSFYKLKSKFSIRLECAKGWE